MVFFVSMDACKCHCARGDSIAGGGSCVVVVAVSGGYFRVPAVFCKDGIMPAKGVGVVPASKPCTHALSHAVHNAAGMRKTSLRKCKSRTPHLGLPVAPAMQSICHSKCFGRTSACKRPALCSTTSLTPETTNTWRRRTTHGKGSLVGRLSLLVTAVQAKDRASHRTNTTSQHPWTGSCTAATSSVPSCDRVSKECFAQVRIAHNVPGICRQPGSLKIDLILSGLQDVKRGGFQGQRKCLGARGGGGRGRR